MAEILHWIMDSIRAYGPWSVFLGVIVESVIVPIPSPIVIMGAGFILISADLTAIEAMIPISLMIVLPGSVASTLGAYIGYAIGYLGGRHIVDRWRTFLGFGWTEISALERRFRRGSIKVTLFFLRAVPIFPLSLISIAAGFMHLPLKLFSLWTFYGSVPRCLLLGYLGWWMGETYQKFAYGIDRVETLTSLLLILLVLSTILWLRRRVRKIMTD
jgi:membrane protein DedA with SNARE-associated domain